MKTLYVRNVPESLHAKLKRLAARNRRSMGAQVVIIVDQALSGESPRRASSRALARIEKRMRGYTAPADAVDSVEMLREDRER